MTHLPDCVIGRKIEQYSCIDEDASSKNPVTMFEHIKLVDVSKTFFSRVFGDS